MEVEGSRFTSMLERRKIDGWTLMPALSYVLARSGKLVGVIGGPLCRTTLRLGHRVPGPRPLRGCDGLRWGLQDLSVPDQQKTDLDTVFVLRQLVVWDWRKPRSNCVLDGEPGRPDELHPRSGGGHAELLELAGGP